MKTVNTILALCDYLYLAIHLDNKTKVFYFLGEFTDLK